MVEFQTEEEQFWAGKFGDAYSTRNQNPKLIAAKHAFLSQALARTNGIESILEIGANVGLNILSLQTLFPEASMAAVEINKFAYEGLRKIPKIDAIHGSIFDFTTSKKYSLVLSSGTMIHVNPDYLPKMYEQMYNCSDQYILVAEYYNPTPVTVTYRGHGNRLFKRDFAGEMLCRYADLQLVDYGFIYHRDPNFALDDLNWFLLEKR